MLRLKRVIEGFTSVVIGVMLIASSMGALSWRVWATLLSLWPLLLVAIGIDLLGKGLRLSIMRVFGSLVILGALSGVLFLGPGTGSGWRLSWGDSQPFELAAAETDATECSARIEVPAAVVSVTDGEKLFAVTGSMPGEVQELAEETSGDHASFEFSVPTVTTVLPTDAYADVALGREASWELELDVGATDADLDLAANTLSGLRVGSGVAVLDVELGDPAEREVPIVVETGLAVVNIRVPEGTAVRVVSEYGMGTTNVPGAWNRLSGERVWESAEFDRARRSYLIRVETGMGIVDVETY